jgi:phosphoglycerate kinase
VASLTAADVKGKRVLVRADFNVPLDDQGNITDDTRIRAALPTIQDLTGKGGKVVLTSHFGRPKGKVVDSMRLTPVAKRLSELLGQEVVKCDDCIGDAVAAAVNGLDNGQVALLENVRFYAGRRSQRSRICQAAGGQCRPVCERCLRHRPPGPRLHRRGDRSTSAPRWLAI